MHNQPREPQPYEDLKQNQFKNLGELHKEWTESGVKHQEHHTQTCRGIWLQLSSEASYLG